MANYNINGRNGLPRVVSDWTNTFFALFFIMSCTEDETLGIIQDNFDAGHTNKVDGKWTAFI